MSETDKKFLAWLKDSQIVWLVLLRGAMCGAVLLAAAVIAQILIRTEPKPVKAERAERASRVALIEAVFEDVPVTIAGFGEVRSRDVVQIAPEVSGRVVAVHPRLEIGELIPEGELLFQIDPRDYEARAAEAEAAVAQLTSSVAAFRRQFEIDKDRLLTFERSRQVAANEYQRIQTLYVEDQVGTQSSVEQSEMAFNNAKDAADQLSQAVDLYPMRIQEAESALKSAEARLDLAQVNLERTRVVAPFDARLKEVALESGQFVAPGAHVLTLADDSLLEISVSLNSQEAREWLQFESDRTANGNAWFGDVVQVPVDVYWTENEAEHWTGTLHRVEKFDQDTRTITVAVRIAGEKILSDTDARMPLVEGMFCRVAIPGKVAKDVVKIPIEAVGFDRDADGTRTAYLARRDDKGDLRLESVSVTECYMDAENVCVRGNIEPGDLIVGTRLVNPLERSLLVALDDTEPQSRPDNVE